MDSRYVRPGFEVALAHLAEECGELIQAVAKTLRWGPRNYDPTVEVREYNEEWVLREISDVEEAIGRFRSEMEGLTVAQRLKIRGFAEKTSDG